MKENREEIIEFLDAIINNDKYIKESQDFILDNLVLRVNMIRKQVLFIYGQQMYMKV